MARARLKVRRRVITAVVRMTEIEHVVRNVGEQILADAKARVPVDTGTLRDGGTIEIGMSRSNNPVPGTASPEVVTARVGFSTYKKTGVFYAPFVELGTKNMRARPFLRPAAYKKRRVVI